jgi:hypothetical protein
MSSQQFETENGSFNIRQVREGMEVYDVNHVRLGKVDDLYFGEVNEVEAERGEGAATARDRSTRGDSLIDDFARVFVNPDDIPEEVRARLLREGFIRVDALLAPARYILPSQISHVDKDHVHLSVGRDELVKW